MTPTIKNQKIDDTYIQYLLYGDQNSQPLIMLHATGFLPWLWHPLARELANKYYVLSPYFCDHRHTDPEFGGLNWLQLAEDLHGFCMEMKIHTPFLVGHSMGATVATLAMTKCGLVAKKCVLIEPIFLPDHIYESRISVDKHPLASKSIKRKNYWDNQEEAIAYLKSKPLFQNWDEEMLQLYIEHGLIPKKEGGLQLVCHPKKEASLFMGGIQINPWPTLPDIQCDTLVIEGETSENRPYIDLQKAAALIPNGHYQLIKNAGHLIPMEKPKQCLKLIHDFFE